MSKQKNLFISHHHADDEHVTRLTNMLKRNGFELRNSSIHAEQTNQVGLDRGLVSDETIKRLLRMKIAWDQPLSFSLPRVSVHIQSTPHSSFCHSTTYKMVSAGLLAECAQHIGRSDRSL